MLAAAAAQSPPGQPWRELKKGTANKQLPDNSINTRRYTWWSFLPLSLLGQFRKLSNLYFLVTASVMLVPDISPLDPLSAIGPLLFVIGVSLAREFLEELQAWRRDVEANSRSVRVLLSSSSLHASRPLSSVFPGECLLVQEGEKIPADLLLLEAAASVAFVETSNLDGELNLKARALVARPGNGQEPWVVRVEPPHADMYRCEGELVAGDAGGNFRFTAEQVLLRDSTLRNTAWVVGLALYTGRETKTALNAGRKAEQKRTRLERVLGKVVVSVFVVQVLLCLVVVLNQREISDHLWYLAGVENNKVTFTYFTAFILLNTLIPVSLWVSLEILKLAQCVVIERRENFRCNAKNLTEDLGVVTHLFSDKTGTLTQNRMQLKALAVVASPDVCDILPPPQLDFLADQSQTLPHQHPEPQLQMPLRFSGVTPASAALVAAVTSAAGRAQAVEQLLLALALCHSCERVLVSGEVADGGELLTGGADRGGAAACCRPRSAGSSPKTRRAKQKEQAEVTHQATSPDEAALVLGAAQCGVEFVERRADGRVELAVRGERRGYRQRHVVGFSSERRMMSVVVEDEDSGRILVFTKGADQNVLARASDDGTTGAVEEAVKTLSERGLRVLVVGRRELGRAEWEELAQELQQTGDEEKRRRREEAERRLESDLEIVGVTAVEDKLQERVQETLEGLQAAGIKVAMITGDKRETAINIARSCGLIRSRQNIYTMLYKNNSVSAGGGQFVPVKHLDEIERMHHGNKEDGNFFASVISRSASVNTNLHGRATAESARYSLVIEGGLLTSILGVAAEEKRLVSVVNHAQCESAVFCRVNPKQKAQIVRVFARSRDAVCLAVGDGANDVNMITSAHVGVGIRGVEGQAAASSGDYAIDRFSDLYKLIFKHGRVNSVRTSFFVLLFLYKNFLFSLCQFWHYTVSMWSGQSVFEDWYVLGYNSTFMVLPLFAYGLLDKDVNIDVDRALRYPEISEQAWWRVFVPTLYIASVQNSYFNYFRIARWLLLGVAHSLVLFYCVEYGVAFASRETPIWLWASGVTLYSGVFVVVAGMIGLQMTEWRWLSLLLTFLNAVMYVSFILIWSLLDSTKVFGVTNATLGCGNFWLIILLACSFCLLPVAAGRKFRLLLQPSVLVTARMAAQEPDSRLGSANERI